MKKVLAADFLSEMSIEERNVWKVKHGKSVTESLRQFVIELVGKPIERLLRLVDMEILWTLLWSIANQDYGVFTFTST